MNSPRRLPSLRALALLALATFAGPVHAQTQAPAGTTPPVSAPAPAPTKPARETQTPPPDFSPAKPAPDPEPKGRWGPIDQYNKNTKCYVGGHYVPAPPLCPN